MRFAKFSDFVSNITLHVTMGFEGDVRIVSNLEKEHVICYQDSILKTINKEDVIYITNFVQKLPDIEGLKEILTLIRIDEKSKVCIKPKKSIINVNICIYERKV